VETFKARRAIADVNDFGQRELVTPKALHDTVEKYKATVLILGHGSKGQIADVPRTLRAVDGVADSLDREYGRGRWLAVFGGDPFNREAPDVAHVVKHLQERRGAPTLAIQSDQIREWGGVDSHLDFVHYVPTSHRDGKIIWGGSLDGRAVGPTATYLGPGFVKGKKAPLKRVIAVGGGSTTLQEVQLAKQLNVPITYVRSRARNAEEAGPYGAVDAWALTNRGSMLDIVGS
jgi:hypothetical protein